MTLKDFREKVNLFIYDSKPRVLGTLSFLNVLVSLAAIGVLIYYYGFNLTKDVKELCFNILEFSFGFYILRFLIKIF